MMHRPLFSAARHAAAAAHPHARSSSSSNNNQRSDNKANRVLTKHAADQQHSMQAADRADGAECDAYVRAVHKWHDTVHAAWLRRCSKRRAKHAARVLLGGDDDAAAASMPREPQCDIEPPECVQRFVDRLMSMPVAKRAEHCRNGAGGHPGFVLARKLVLANSDKVFAASDAELAKERADSMAAAKALERAKQETGPDGETQATHDKVVEVQKSGGKGQTIKVATWVLRN